MPALPALTHLPARLRTPVRLRTTARTRLPAGRRTPVGLRMPAGLRIPAGRRMPAGLRLPSAMPRLPSMPRTPSMPRPSAKRVFDLTAGPLLLLAAAPVLLLAAAACAATSPGPVLVRRTRTGLGGRPFEMLSLRTAPSTPVGRLLRRTRVDVLPRLLHVLRGEMSLVGPCALPPGHPEGALVGRQLMRPGLTGLWQVGGRSDLPWDEMGVLDAHYLDHHWLGLDLKILARTVPAALAMRR